MDGFQLLQLILNSILGQIKSQGPGLIGSKVGAAVVDKLEKKPKRP